MHYIIWYCNIISISNKAIFNKLALSQFPCKISAQGQFQLGGQKTCLLWTYLAEFKVSFSFCLGCREVENAAAHLTF